MNYILQCLKKQKENKNINNTIKTISTYGEESLTSPTLSDKHGSHTVTMTTPRTPVMESHLIAAQAQGPGLIVILHFPY